jgi:hypothetical protein
MLLNTNLSRKELLVEYIKSHTFYNIELISRILGDDEIWWNEIVSNHEYNKFIQLSQPIIYNVFNSLYPKNCIKFCHDFLNYSYIADYVDGYINYCFSDTDHLEFKQFYDDNNLVMNQNQLNFYEWLQNPIDIKQEESGEEDFFLRFGEK